MTRALRKTEVSDVTGPEAGFLFEGYIFHELSAYLSYYEIDKELSFFKTHDGNEIDFVVGNGELLIETTISSNIRAPDVRGLNSLMDAFPSPKKALVICTESQKRLITNKVGTNEITIYPWRAFLEELWDGKIL